MGLGSLGVLAIHAQVAHVAPGPLGWFRAGSGVELPKEMTFEDPLGRLGVLNADGPVTTKGHPFFEPLGPNGRACVTCHQPANVSVNVIQERWRGD